MSELPLNGISAAIAKPAVAVQESSVRNLPNAVAPPTPVSPSAMLALAHQIGQAITSKGTGLNYSVDTSSGSPRVSIIDGETGAVIQQFPSDQMLNLAKLIDTPGGILLNQIS